MHQPACDKLTRRVQEMVTLFGFITVVDTASFPDITVSLRRRIESGEVLGPHIYTAGGDSFRKCASVPCERAAAGIPG